MWSQAPSANLCLLCLFVCCSFKHLHFVWQAVNCFLQAAGAWLCSTTLECSAKCLWQTIKLSNVQKLCTVKLQIKKSNEWTSLMTFYGRCHNSRKAVESRVQKRRGTMHDNTWQSLIAHLPPLPPDPATESLFWCIEQGISLASLAYPTSFATSSYNPQASISSL